MTVLCLLETEPSGGAIDASMRALTVGAALASSAGEDLGAAWFGAEPDVDTEALAAAGVVQGWAIASPRLSGYAPLAWARALSGLAASGDGYAGGPGGLVSAVVAAAT